MADYDAIKEKTIALVVWNTGKQNDAHVYLGEIIDIDNQLTFINPSKNWAVTLEPGFFESLKEVPIGLKEVLLGADYFFSMSMGNLSEDSNERFVETGLKWHNED